MLKPSLLLAALVSLPAASHSIEITYLLKSYHVVPGEFNGEHNFIGAEYRTGDHGFAVASFTNSYYVQSYLADYAHYWQPFEFVEASVRAGFVSGYDDYWVTASAGVAYTKYRYVVPKLSIIAGAVTLSFSARF